MNRFRYEFFFFILHLQTFSSFINAQQSECVKQHVIIIGLDGLGAEYLKQNWMNTPNLKYLYENGAATLNAHSFEPVLSLPNWGALILGANPSITGLQGNNDKLQEMPTMLNALKKADIRTALYTDWDNLKNIIHSGVDKYVFDAKLKSLTEKFIKHVKKISSPTSFSFIHYDNIDHAGHNFNFGSEEYYNQMNIADENVGRIVAASKHLDPLIIVVSDHGGVGTGHGKTMNKDMPAEINIPIIAYAATSIKDAVVNIADLTDVAATVLAMFNIEAPNSFTGISRLPSLFTCSHHQSESQSSSASALSYFFSVTFALFFAFSS